MTLNANCLLGDSESAGGLNSSSHRKHCMDQLNVDSSGQLEWHSCLSANQRRWADPLDHCRQSVCSEFEEKNQIKLNQVGEIRVLAAVTATATTTTQNPVATDEPLVVSKPTTGDNGISLFDDSRVKHFLETGVWKFWWIPFLVIMILLILGITVFIIVSRRRRRQRKRSQMRRN